MANTQLIEKRIKAIRLKWIVRMDEKGGKNALVYGLCKGEGIDTTGMEPKEAWEAYEKKTGKTAVQTFAEKNLDDLDDTELHKWRDEIRERLNKETDDVKFNDLLKSFKKFDAEIKKRESADHGKPSESGGKGDDPIEHGKKTAGKAQVKLSGNGPFSKDAYSKERKDNSFRTRRPVEADAALRPKLEEVWQNATTEDQRTAITYTRWSGYYNKPQREAGINGDFSAQDERIDRLTKLIEKSTYDFDMNMQRGTSPSGASAFLEVDEDFLKNAPVSELKKALVGTMPIEYGFSSTGAAEGYGAPTKTDPKYTVQYRIYAPAGTQMLYCEPFSWFNKENDGPPNWDFYHWWDGKSKQKEAFSQELELLVQRNTRYLVTDVSRGKDGVLWVDLDIIGQGEEDAGRRADR
ncbi:MAG: hypothetical protein IJM76_05850 [Lachnospiraceae bacterium]|nr:hypothetical protein [Lachnospiraceae bacterium]